MAKCGAFCPEAKRKGDVSGWPLGSERSKGKVARWREARGERRSERRAPAREPRRTRKLAKELKVGTVLRTVLGSTGEFRIGPRNTRKARNGLTAKSAETREGGEGRQI